MKMRMAMIGFALIAPLSVALGSQVLQSRHADEGAMLGPPFQRGLPTEISKGAGGLHRSARGQRRHALREVPRQGLSEQL